MAKRSAYPGVPKSSKVPTPKETPSSDVVVPTHERATREITGGGASEKPMLTVISSETTSPEVRQLLMRTDRSAEEFAKLKKYREGEARDNTVRMEIEMLSDIINSATAEMDVIGSRINSTRNETQRISLRKDLVQLEEALHTALENKHELGKLLTQSNAGKKTLEITAAQLPETLKIPKVSAEGVSETVEMPPIQSPVTEEGPKTVKMERAVLKPTRPAKEKPVEKPTDIVSALEKTKRKKKAEEVVPVPPPFEPAYISPPESRKKMETHKAGPEMDTSAWFADRLTERTENGVTYGEYSSASPEVVNNLGYDASFASAFGKVDLITNKGGDSAKYEWNEDSGFAISREGYLAVGIVDGMGGVGKEGAGLKASRFVSAVTESALRKDGVSMGDVKKEIEDGFKTSAVHDRGAACGVIMQMKSENGQIRVEALSAGDTKMLTLRGGKKFAEGTTRMHNGVMEYLEGEMKKDPSVDRTSEYYNFPGNNFVTSGFGVPRAQAQRDPETIAFNAQKGDRMILASDGVWDLVSEYEVEQLSAQYPDNSDFQTELYNLAMSRQNSKGAEFIIMHDANTPIKKRVPEGHGDNVSLAIVTVETVPILEKRNATKEASSTPNKAAEKPLTLAEADRVDELERKILDARNEASTIDNDARMQKENVMRSLEDERSKLMERRHQMGRFGRWLRFDFRSEEALDKKINEVNAKLGNPYEQDPGLKKAKEAVDALTAQINEMEKELAALRRRRAA